MTKTISTAVNAVKQSNLLGELKRLWFLVTMICFTYFTEVIPGPNSSREMDEDTGELL